MSIYRFRNGSARHWVRIGPAAKIKRFALSLGASLILAGSTASLAQQTATLHASAPGGASKAAPADAAGPEFIPGELLVGFQPGAAGRANAIRSQISAQKLKEWPTIQAEHWKLPPGLDVERAVQILSANPNVSFAEPNYIWRTMDLVLPNDSHVGDLWGMHNVGQDRGLGDADIDALEAWQVAPGAGAVVVAVIDTGIDYTHPDLQGCIWINPGEIPDDGIDNDNNGYVDDYYGYDFYNNDADPMDDHGHGTHVSGTIAGTGNNGIGVIGVAGLNANVRLMPVKFLGAGGSAPTDIAVSCVLYAASFKDAEGNPRVRISNNSWGGGAKSKTLENAIKNSGALFCASAGNRASTTVNYPAGYNLANVLAVAATDRTDALASFSTYGSWVHLAAPGVAVLSTYLRDDYRVFNGTSMATPHAVGAAALVLSANPSWSNAQLKQRLLDAVDRLPSLAGKVSSEGRLNVRKALDAPELSEAPAALNRVTDVLASFSTPNSLTLEWNNPNDPPGYLYDIRYRTHPELNDPADAPPSWSDDEWNTATTVFGEPPAAAEASTFILNGLSPVMVYTFAVRVFDPTGTGSDISVPGAGKTVATGWRAETISNGRSGGYNSMAFDPTDSPAIAFSYTDANGENPQLRYAHRSDGVWEEEVIAGGSHAGIALGFGLNSQPSVVSSSEGKLNFANRSSEGSWAITEIDSTSGDVNSLAWDSAENPSISYRIANTSDRVATYPLKFAWRTGTIWRTATVTASTIRYNSLAYNPDGHPVIAYSADLDEDGRLDTLAIVEGLFNADRTSVAWSTPEIVASGGGGNGVFVNLKFDGELPTLIHEINSQIHYSVKSNGEWTTEPVAAGSYPSLAYANHAVVAYSADGFVQLARRIAPGHWQTRWQEGFTGPVDEGYTWWLPSVAVDSMGNVALSYQMLGQLRFAEPGEATPVIRQLYVRAWTDKPEYINGEIMHSYFQVTLGSSDGSVVEGANMRVEMIDPKGTLWTAQGTTGSTGIFEATWKVNAGRAGKGTYKIAGFASKLGYFGASGDTSFVVK